MTSTGDRIAIRPAERGDQARIVAVNAAAVLQTSAMDLERLAVLAALACYLKVAVVGESIAAFLLALREGMPYDNDNYRWISGHFDKFIYIDRIVVSAEFAGRGLGRQLYEDLFSYARLNGIRKVTCEYNINPPNPVSAAFHRSMTFREIGTQWVAHGSKQVSLQLAEV